MKRIDVVKEVMNDGIVAVVRAESKEKGINIVDAAQKGGIKLMEITMTVPGAVDIIKELCEKYKDTDVVIGAGTVLDSETARICILNGAKFIVSPCFNEEVVKTANRYAVPVMPGVYTPKEAVAALESGVDIIKIFPGAMGGPSIIKNFKGPLPQGNYMPSGGVNLENVKDWVKAGAVAVSTGSSLTKGAETGNYDLVTKTAEEFVEELKKARAEVEK